MLRTMSIRLLAASLALAGATPLAVAADKSVCIQTNLIDHTEIPNDTTILFHMRNKQVWKNTLINRCPTLRNNTQGFSYSPTIPGSNEICSNLVTIRVNDTGETCLLGEFTPG